MIDALGRNIQYMRLSLTQRCNLRCVYCNPGGETQSDVLTPAQLERIVFALAQLGINKVRLTGGEPLLRTDLEQIVGRIAAIPQIEDLCLTTNAQGLSKRMPALTQAGLRRVNISIDSLNEQKYRKITGGGSVQEVLQGIDSALELGIPVKLNAVLMRGVNDEEVDAFILLAKDRAISVRFIELMPIGKLGEDGTKKVPNAQIIARRTDLIPCAPQYPSQPSEDYTIQGYKGKIGFISPVSHKFCHLCNRVRITADGKFKPCLGDNGEVSLLDVLDESDARLIEFLRDAIFHKPKGHNFAQGFISTRKMSDIGG